MKPIELILKEKKEGPYQGYIVQKRIQLQELKSKQNCLNDPCSHGGILPFELEIPKITKKKKKNMLVLKHY